MSEHTSSHAPEHLEVQPDTDIRAGVIAALGLFFALVLAAIFLVLHSLFLGLKDEALHDKVYGVVDPKLIELRTHEAEQLGSYKVLDKATGRYQLPIDRAMELVVRDYAMKRPSDTKATDASQPSPVTPGEPPADGAAVPPQTTTDAPNGETGGAVK